MALQGQRAISEHGTSPLGLGSTSLSGYGLCYESSSDSTASSGFLPPVPSLPGISAPATSISSGQQLQFAKKSASAGSSISPTKLKAWQCGRQLPRQQGGEQSNHLEAAETSHCLDSNTMYAPW